MSRFALRLDARPQEATKRVAWKGNRPHVKFHNNHKDLLNYFVFSTL